MIDSKEGKERSVQESHLLRCARGRAQSRRGEDGGTYLDVVALLRLALQLCLHLKPADHLKLKHNRLFAWRQQHPHQNVYAKVCVGHAMQECMKEKRN